MATIAENIGVLGTLFAQLRDMTEEKGVRESPKSSIIEGEAKKDVDSNLTTNEVSRVQKSSELLADTLARHFKLGKYTEKEKTLGDLTPDKIKKTIPPTTLQTTTGPEKKGDWKSILLGLLPMLGFLDGITLDGVITALGTRIDAWLRKLKIGPAIMKTLRFLARGLWKAIKFVGRLLLKPFIWLYETKLKPWLKKQGDKIKMFLKKRVDTVRNFFKPLTSGLSRMLKAVRGGISSFSKTIREGIEKTLGAAKNALSKIPGVGKLVEKILPSGGKAAGTAVAGAAGAAVGGVAGEVGEETAKRGFAARIAKKTFEWGQEKIGRYFGKLFAQTPKALGSLLQRIPFVGGIFEGIGFKGDIDKMKEDYSKGVITKEELIYNAGRRVAEGVAAIGGAAIGGVLGSALGPIGSILGAVGGDALGRWAGGVFVDKVVSPSITKKIGEFVVGGEMQDFLIKDGKVFRFSNKDEILGMRTGGAVDGLLRDLSHVITQSNSIIIRKASEQVERLEEIVYILRTNISKLGSQQSQPPLFPNRSGSSMLGYDRTTLNSRTLIV